MGRKLSLGTIFGLGTLSCIGCCAAPLLIALGVSAGASAAIAIWTERIAMIAFGAAVLVIGIVWFRRRRAQRASGCADACSVDGSCGCSPTVAGCTLPREDERERMDAFRELFERGLHRTERRPGSVAFVFRDDEVTAGRVNALIELESRCCSFLRFDVKRSGGELRWTTRASHEHADVLGTWADLPMLASR